MELRNLTTFTKIAQTKNFTKAAAQLGYSQSAISSQIQQLEKELGVPVFDRIGKTVSLTQAGEILYQYANAMLTLEQNAIDSIRNQVTLAGELRIAIEESLSISFLPDILHHYRSQYPNVDLIVTAADSRQMFHMLKENEIDMIYTLDRINTQPGLIVPRYLEEPILFIAPVSHSFSIKQPSCRLHPNLPWPTSPVH